MSVTTHFPPGYSGIGDFEPLIFLEGPIQGAPDWQAEATEIITDIWNAQGEGLPLHIASPRRGELKDDFDYDIQVKWEKYHLKRAARNGAILVWFAAQDHSLTYESGREYAKTTKGELTREIGWLDYNPNINLFVGIEPGFESLSRYQMTCLQEYNLGSYVDLESLCEVAVKSVIED